MVEKMPSGIFHRSAKRAYGFPVVNDRGSLWPARSTMSRRCLILDESTSALDAETADEIISELRQLKGKVTIVVITHQDALLGLCNKVYRLEGGKLRFNRADLRMARCGS